MDAFSDIRSAPGQIKLHDAADFDGMRRAGRLAAECLDLITTMMVPGALTADIDRVAREFVLDNGAYPACLFYKGYSHTVCISPNHVVCHGIPGDRVLREGDIANVDVTVILDGWHGDTSRMYPIGEVNTRARKLVEVTYDCLEAGLAAIRPGAHFGDIGAAIEAVARANRFTVVHEFCGHGVGRVFHDEPNVMHARSYTRSGAVDLGPELKPGMFFTVEPMINAGKPSTKVLNDGWTAVTRDKSLSAQCEHSVGVTETGVELFTASPTGQFRPTFA